MSFRCGITESTRKAIVWKGESRRSRGRARPRGRRARRRSPPRAAGGDEARDRQRQLGAASPWSTATMPPPRSARRSTATSMSSSDIPTTTIVRVAADRRRERARCRPKPRTRPTPTRPVPRCRSKTAILARSSSTVGDHVAVRDRRLVLERLRDDLARITPRTRTRPPFGRGSRGPPAAPVRAARCAAPSRGPPAAGRLERAAALSTSSGSKRSRSGSSSRSAW